MAALLRVDLDPALLATALTHRSFAYEHGVPDNERLEFLGDSVLGRGVTAMLYERFPDDDEGALAKRRAGLVSTTALASVARELGVGRYLRLGRGEVRTGGAEKASILADAVEALIGAVFVALGSEAAEALVLRLIVPVMEDPVRSGAISDPKTELQELASRRGEPAPVYALDGEGPEHARMFRATVTVGAVAGEGTGTSKKQAEVAAAWAALAALSAQP